MPSAVGPRLRSVSSDRGFTLIELMVVILIVAVLTAIGLAVARSVSQGGKTNATLDVIRSMEQILSAYTAEKQAVPPARFVDGQGNEFPVFDGRIEGQDETAAIQPSVTLFMLTARTMGSVEELLKGLDQRFVVYTPRVETAWGTPRDENGNDLPAVTILDAFGEPIRLVHPFYDGGYGDYWDGDSIESGRDALTISPVPQGGPTELRRSYRPFDPNTASSAAVGDADEGLCANERPYFYSGGLDKDAGTRSDNVYSTRPSYPSSTAAFAD